MSRRNGAVAFVSVVALGVLSGVLLARLDHATPTQSTSLSSSSESALTPQVHGNMVLSPGPAPFREALAYPSIEAAIAAVPEVATIPRPTAALASDDTVTLVWSTPHANSVEIQYVSGLKIQFTPALQRLRDPASARAAFDSEAEEAATATQGRARVVDIASVPALLFPDGAFVLANGESQGTPALLEFVVGARIVDLIGHVTDRDLIAVASSLVDAA